MKIYFAHCVADYDTERERRAMRVIKAHIKGCTITNPSTARMQKYYRAQGAHEDPMAYWRRVVRGCDGVAFLRTDDQNVGAGVATEILEAIVHGKPVWSIDIDDDSSFIERSAMPSDVMSIEQTRALNKRAGK